MDLTGAEYGTIATCCLHDNEPQSQK